MKPCQRCGALGNDPCVTASGNLAAAWHKVRTEVVRSPRELELAFEKSVERAPWLGPLDSAAVAAVALLARQIDDKVHGAETQGGLVPVAPLADEGGALTYPADTFLRGCDGLGLTPRGRHMLALEGLEEGDDELGTIVSLHR